MFSLCIQAFVGEVLFLTERAIGFYIFNPAILSVSSHLDN